MAICPAGNIPEGYFLEYVLVSILIQFDWFDKQPMLDGGWDHVLPFH